MTDEPKLKIGFDLDGVILYNPVRIFRPLVAGAKRLFIKKRVGKFYVPKSRPEQLFWELFHKSSIFAAPGFQELKQLVDEGKIEAYLVTARYSHLKRDLDKWIEKIGARNIFKNIHYNQHDEQPHLFKERMINKYKFDYFIEDNWDIVKYLAKKNKENSLPTRVYWISNLLDYRIPYPHKFPVLKKALEAIMHKQ